MKNKYFFFSLIAYFFFQHFIDTKSISSHLFFIFEDHPVGGKPLSIFLNKLPKKYNKYVTPSHCVSCDCSFQNQNDLEPLIHCILEKSKFIVQNPSQATFIFDTYYTNNIRLYNSSSESFSKAASSEIFQKWKGARNLQVDSFDPTESSNISSFEFNDQHVLITTNLSLPFIRSNRWLNSRHILIPPLQSLKKYPKLSFSQKTSSVTFVANISSPNFHAIENIAKQMKADLITDIPQAIGTLNKVKISEFVKHVSQSNFTIFDLSNNSPSLFYEIIRAHSIPVLITESFLPAFANTHIKYGKMSIKIPPQNISLIQQRLSKMNVEEAFKELEKAANWLSWPLDGIATDENAGGVLLDYLNTRHRVLKPVLRRNFFGSEKVIF